MDSIFIGFNRQLRIVSALLIREVRLRNSKHAFMQLFDLLEALFYIVIHWVIFTYTGRHIIIGDSLLTFITTGVAPVLYFRTISIRTASAIVASKHLRTIPGILPLDYALARSCVEVLSFVTMFTAFLAGVYISGASKNAIPYDFAPIIISISSLTVMAFGIGLFNSFVISVFPLWKFTWAILSRVQIFFSAVFFMPEYMHPQLRAMLEWSPMLHFVSLFRTGFYATYPTHLISIPYMLSFAFGALIIGLALERILRDHLH